MARTGADDEQSIMVPTDDRLHSRCRLVLASRWLIRPYGRASEFALDGRAAGS
jgi:hypothetical protein